ncbi:hypothetical protein TNCV_4651211 [Trichonephila clavipes]|nr:hypothetical protein TNCV_4651211 [Trichonephila clavipes]
MLKHLRFEILELQDTKLPVRRINTTNERRLVQGHGTLLKVKRDITDGSGKLDNEDFRLPFLDEIPRIILLSAS